LRLFGLAERHLRNTGCGRTAVLLAARRLDRLASTGRYLWLDDLVRRRSWTVDGLRTGRSAVGCGSRFRRRSRRPSVGSTPAAVRVSGCLGGRRFACERFFEPADDRRLDCR